MTLEDIVLSGQWVFLAYFIGINAGYLLQNVIATHSIRKYMLTAEHTEAEGSVCVGCHSTLINPYGFPFEHYDAVGGYRLDDNGLPVDAATEVLLGGELVPVSDATDLVEALAGSAEVHGCYLGHWIEYALGRPSASEDKPLVERLSLDSLDGVAVQDLLVALVTSRPFLSRATEELP